jgi:uncharacterized protein YndB with AHSA1/START domain
MEGRAFERDGVFRSEWGVSIAVGAPAARVWALLTDAADFPRWSSTVTRIQGRIALGERLKIKVPSSDRSFGVEVSELVLEQRMVWSGGAALLFKGVRTFTLTPRPDGGVEFSMVEVMSGVMLPLIKSSLPDLAQPFEQFAADLKREAERA